MGCPKALVDSELILTQLSAEGYETAKDYSGADLVVVNTCGFIDSAVEESLSVIGEALAENGKVIVTGCLGARKNPDGSDLIQSIHPKVLAVTGPHATDEVMQAIHLHLPKPHDPFTDLVPPAGIKLTPKHYAYLKISGASPIVRPIPPDSSTRSISTWIRLPTFLVRRLMDISSALAINLARRSSRIESGTGFSS